METITPRQSCNALLWLLSALDIVKFYTNGTRDKNLIRSILKIEKMTMKYLERYGKR